MIKVLTIKKKDKFVYLNPRQFRRAQRDIWGGEGYTLSMPITSTFVIALGSDGTILVPTLDKSNDRCDNHNSLDFLVV